MVIRGTTSSKCYQLLPEKENTGVKDQEMSFLIEKKDLFSFKGEGNLFFLGWYEESLFSTVKACLCAD